MDVTSPMATEGTETPQTYTRAFYPSEYRRASSLVRSARVNRDGTPKSPTAQEAITALADVMSTMFGYDSDEANGPAYQAFDAQAFQASTAVPAPQGTEDLDETPEDDEFPAWDNGEDDIEA